MKQTQTFVEDKNKTDRKSRASTSDRFRVLRKRGSPLINLTNGNMEQNSHLSGRTARVPLRDIFKDDLPRYTETDWAIAIDKPKYLFAAMTTKPHQPPALSGECATTLYELMLMANKLAVFYAN